MMFFLRSAMPVVVSALTLTASLAAFAEDIHSLLERMAAIVNKQMVGNRLDQYTTLGGVRYDKRETTFYYLYSVTGLPPAFTANLSPGQIQAMRQPQLRQTCSLFTAKNLPPSVKVVHSYSAGQPAREFVRFTFTPRDCR